MGDLEAYLDSAIDEKQRQMMAPHGKEGVSGTELMELMRQQAKNSGARVITRDIVSVDFSGNPVEGKPFVLTDSDGQTLEALSVIVATGARANYLGMESEETYRNKGVSACAVCDGALPRFRNKPLAVIGGGDSAVEEADYLSKFAAKVYLVHRRDELRASKVMAQACHGQFQDRNPLEPHTRRDPGQRKRRRDGHPAQEHRRRRRYRTGSHRACSWPSATHPIRPSSSDSLELTKKKYINWVTARPHAIPASKAFSPPATWPTTTTARR